MNPGSLYNTTTDEDVIFDQSHNELLDGEHSVGQISLSSANLSAVAMGQHKVKSYKVGKLLRTAALCGAYFALGLCMAVTGPTLPHLQAQVDTTVAKISFIFTARSVGTLLGSFACGILFDRYNRYSLLFLAMLGIAIGIGSMPWCRHLWLLMAASILIGFANGFLDTGASVLCLDLWGSDASPYMQALHFFFGLGGFVTPLLAQSFLGSGDLSHTVSPITLPRHVRSLPFINNGSWETVDGFNFTTPGEVESTLLYNITENIENNTALLSSLFTEAVVNTESSAFLLSNITSNITEAAAVGTTLAASVVTTALKPNGTTANMTEIPVNLTSTKLPKPKPKPSVIDGSLLGNSKVWDDIPLPQVPAEEPAPLPVTTSTPSTATVGVPATQSNGTNINIENVTMPSNTSVEVSNAPSEPTGQNGTLPDSTGNRPPVDPSQALANATYSANSDLPMSTVTPGLDNSTMKDVYNVSTLPSATPNNLTSVSSENSALTANFTGYGPEDSSVSNLTLPFSSPESNLSMTDSVAPSNIPATLKPISDDIASSTLMSHPNNRTLLNTDPATVLATDYGNSTLTKASSTTTTTYPATPQNIPVPTVPTGTLTGSEPGRNATAPPPMDKPADLPPQGNPAANETNNPEFFQTAVTSQPQSLNTQADDTLETVSLGEANLATKSRGKSRGQQDDSLEKTETMVTTTQSTIRYKPATSTNGSEDEYKGGSRINVDWEKFGMTRMHLLYSIIAVITIHVAFTFLFFLCPSERERMASAAAATRSSAIAARPRRRNILVLLMCLVFLIYVGMEVTYSQFLTTFGLDSSLHLTEESANSITAIFWGSFALTRLAAIFIANCMNPTKMLLVNFLFCFISSVMLCVAGQTSKLVLSIGSAIMGAGMASTFATGFVWTEKRLTVTSRIASAFSISSALGEMITPAITGALFEYDAMALIYFTLGSTCVCVLVVGVAWLLSRKRRGFNESGIFLGNEYQLARQADDEHELS